MEQGKLYVIEEKTYEAHINEEVVSVKPSST